MKRIHSLLLLVAVLLLPSAKAVSLGKFVALTDNVLAQDASAVDEKTVEISGFNNSGNEFDIWLVMGNEKEEVFRREFVQLAFSHVIPTPKDECKALQKYGNEKLRVVLPESITLSNITYISAFGMQFSHNYGFIVIPPDQTFPKSSVVGPARCYL